MNVDVKTRQLRVTIVRTAEWTLQINLGICVLTGDASVKAGKWLATVDVSDPITGFIIACPFLDIIAAITALFSDGDVEFDTLTIGCGHPAVLTTTWLA